MFMVIDRLHVLAALSPTEELAAVPSCHRVVTYFECCHLDSLWTMKTHFSTITTKQTAVDWEMCVCVTT